MGYTKPRIIVILAVFALLISLCFVPSIAGTSSPAEEAEGQDYSSEFSLFYLEAPPVEVDLGGDAIATVEALPVPRETPSSVPEAPDVPAPVPVEEEEPDAPARDPVNEPVASGLNPLLPPPTNLIADYWQQGWGAPRVDLDWDDISSTPGFDHYQLLRWRETAFPAMINIYYQLAAMWPDDPSVLDYAEDFEYQVQLSAQLGLTFDEREAIIGDMEMDLDSLHAIMSNTSGALVPEGLWDQLVALAEINTSTKKQNKYKDLLDRDLDIEQYFVYAVLAVYDTGDTSPPSNSEVVYTYLYDLLPPAQPTGFMALAYDDGVWLEWNRNTESDLVGYNVYFFNGVSWELLNTGGPITEGTYYLHTTGGVGDQYRVEAVDLEGLSSTPAEIQAVLAPITRYDADNLTWQYLGQWVREDYSDPVLYGGSVLRVARDAGAMASLDFTGRNVKVVVSRYWQCGQVRFWIDGVDYGVVNLYKAEPLPARDIEWDYTAFEVNGLVRGAHTLTLEVLGAGCPADPPPSHPDVEYDFVNFQYGETR